MSSEYQICRSRQGVGTVCVAVARAMHGPQACLWFAQEWNHFTLDERGGTLSTLRLKYAAAKRPRTAPRCPATDRSIVARVSVCRSTSLYNIRFLPTMRETYRRTVEVAVARNGSGRRLTGVTPWLALGCVCAQRTLTPRWHTSFSHLISTQGAPLVFLLLQVR